MPVIQLFWTRLFQHASYSVILDKTVFNVPRGNRSTCLRQLSYWVVRLDPRRDGGTAITVDPAYPKFKAMFISQKLRVCMASPPQNVVHLYGFTSKFPAALIFA